MTSAGPPALLIAPFDAPTAQQVQADWARYLGQPIQRTNSLGMMLVLVPAGEFEMGSHESAEVTAEFARSTGWKEAKTENFEDEHPLHKVRITQPFYLGQHEVTIKDFRTFVDEKSYTTEPETDGEGGMGWNESEGKFEGRSPKYTWKNTGFIQTDEHPVTNVTWNDSQAFCNWLSEKEQVKYRLPTEAEWEYAGRAGTTGRFQCGDDPEALLRYGNIGDAGTRAKLANYEITGYLKGNNGFIFTAPAGSFLPNAFGLYDMHGNVWEWCQDWYGKDYYARSGVEDPRGPESGSSRIRRGGGWSNSPWRCRSADRYRSPPGFRYNVSGFRVAQVPSR